LGQDVVLEVAVLGERLLLPGLPAPAHRAERAHPAVDLELLAVHEDLLPRGLRAPGEQGAEHARRGAGRDRLGHVARVLHPAVGDHRHPGPVRDRGGLEDRGDLRGPDTGDHRVVQMDPGPIPTLMASAPASIMACAASRVARLPPITWTRSPSSLLTRETMSSA